MKTLKQENNVKRVRTIIISLVVIAIIGIVVGIILNNKVYAGICSYCGQDSVYYYEVVKRDDTYHDWYYYCTAGCSRLDWYTSGAHTPNADNCTYCGGSSKLIAIGSGGGGSSSCSHPDSYYKYYNTGDDTLHDVYNYCPDCGEEWYDMQLIHDFEDYSYYSSTKHKVECADCGYYTTESHTGASHSNGGVCSKCGEVYQEHGQSTTVSSYNKTADGHTPVYGCTYSGCSGTYTGTIESHTGATHSNGGKCTLSACGYQYENHGQATTVKEYVVTADGHQPTYACTYSGCTQEYTGTIQSHTGATHSNGGICTVDGCGYQYQTHGQGEFKEYISTADGHKAVYACTHSGCTEEYEGEIEDHTGATHSNGGICTVSGCEYQYQTHSQSTTIKYYNKSSSGHTPIYACSYSGCTSTYTGATQSHSGATHSNGGKCTLSACGYQYQTHSKSTTVKKYNTSADGHTPVYECSYSGCTSTYTGTSESHTGGSHSNGGICTLSACGYQYQTHSQSTNVKEYEITANGHTPIYECSYSECSGTYEGTQQNHSGATHSNGGICTVSGCGYQYENHGQESEIKEYNVTADGHTPVYACTYSGCTEEYTGTIQDHTGATHDNGGICTVTGCGYKYETHGQSTIRKQYIKTLDGHTPVYYCTQSGCETTYNGEEQQHSGATHTNGGICTVDGCGYQYENHGQDTVIKEYITSENGHSPVYYCKYPDCNETYKGEEQAHSGATHTNDGICTVAGCGYKYETHEESEEVKEYVVTADGHTPIYYCTHADCDITYEGGLQDHTGASHENQGICTVAGCGYKYQNHGQGAEIKEYKTSVNGHTPVYKCTDANCSQTYDGEEQAHSGGTHTNDGKCTVTGCGYQYENHGQAAGIKEYEVTADGHTPIYYCTHSGCETTYKGEKQEHSGATHENEGKCEVTGCEYQYESHGKSSEIKEYKTTANGHTPVYKCTDANCSKTYDGQEQAHSGATHNNDGKCTVAGCGYQYETHGKSTSIKEYKTSSSGHTPVYSCTDENCQTTYDGEEQKHIGGTHENGGKCTVEGCVYKYQEHGKGTEIKEYKKTVNGHTPIYKCTDEECDETYEGEEQSHNIEEWTDNGDATHSGECTICDHELTENHTYDEDGECTDCGALDPEWECKHTYTFDNDEEYHWEKCTKCGEIKANSKELHQYEEYTDNGDGTHSSTCTVCRYELTDEKHNYEDGKCEECESLEPEKPCEHSYVDANDETYHWKECTECEETKEGSKEKHAYDNYKDNGDGTHTATCTVCGHKLTEEHDEGDECTKCEIDKKDPTPTPKPDDGKDDTGKDTSTADKDIPNAGIQSIIALLVVGIAAVLGISIFKMNKYKDI